MKKIDEIIRGMFVADRPSDYWNNATFPELEASKLIIQQDCKSVYNHTMSVIDLLSFKRSIPLLAGLFHDLGKVYSTDSSRFQNHETSSVYIAIRVLSEWGASGHLIDRVCRIVSTHMYDIVSNTTEKSLRKFVARVGQDNLHYWFVVRKADSASYSKYGKYKQNIIDPFYGIIKAYLKTLPHGHNPTKLESEPNITIGGKESESDNISLLTEGG